MTDEIFLVTLANIEAEIAQRDRQTSGNRASVVVGGPEAPLYAKTLALKGYRTALLKNGRGYRIYAKEWRQ